MITESNMSIMPHAMRRVITSPNSIMPSTAAVTGSSAPIMAVGVEPMQRMAMAINTSDMTVGTKPRVRAMPHCMGVCSICSSPVGLAGRRG